MASLDEVSCGAGATHSDGVADRISIDSAPSVGPTSEVRSEYLRGLFDQGPYLDHMYSAIYRAREPSTCIVNMVMGGGCGGQRPPANQKLPPSNLEFRCYEGGFIIRSLGLNEIQNRARIAKTINQNAQ